MTLPVGAIVRRNATGQDRLSRWGRLPHRAPISRCACDAPTPRPRARENTSSVAERAPTRTRPTSRDHMRTDRQAVLSRNSRRAKLSPLSPPFSTHSLGQAHRSIGQAHRSIGQAHRSIVAVHDRVRGRVERRYVAYRADRKRARVVSCIVHRALIVIRRACREASTNARNSPALSGKVALTRPVVALAYASALGPAKLSAPAVKPR